MKVWPFYFRAGCRVRHGCMHAHWDVVRELNDPSRAQALLFECCRFSARQ